MDYRWVSSRPPALVTALLAAVPGSSIISNGAPTRSASAERPSTCCSKPSPAVLLSSSRPGSSACPPINSVVVWRSGVAHAVLRSLLGGVLVFRTNSVDPATPAQQVERESITPPGPIIEPFLMIGRRQMKLLVGWAQLVLARTKGNVVFDDRCITRRSLRWGDDGGVDSVPGMASSTAGACGQAGPERMRRDLRFEKKRARPLTLATDTK